MNQRVTNNKSPSLLSLSTVTDPPTSMTMTKTATSHPFTPDAGSSTGDVGVVDVVVDYMHGYM